jgi:hypothetical protein
MGTVHPTWHLDHAINAAGQHALVLLRAAGAPNLDCHPLGIIVRNHPHRHSYVSKRPDNAFTLNDPWSA